MNNTVDELMKESCDLHVRAGIDPTTEDKLDALDLARDAYEAHMKTFVLRTDSYSSVPIAKMLSRMYPDLSVLGGVVLNSYVGGINADAVIAIADNGGKAVWIMASELGLQETGNAMGILTKNGQLNSDFSNVLDVIAERDLLLIVDTSWFYGTEIILREAFSRGVRRLLAMDSGNQSVEEFRSMTKFGAFVERAYTWQMPPRTTRSIQEFVASIYAIGVEKCILTTGMGHWYDPSPAAGMRMAIANLIHYGMSVDEVSMLVNINPSGLIEESVD